MLNFKTSACAQPFYEFPLFRDYLFRRGFAFRASPIIVVNTELSAQCIQSELPDPPNRSENDAPYPLVTGQAIIVAPKCVAKVGKCNLHSKLEGGKKYEIFVLIVAMFHRVMCFLFCRQWPLMNCYM